MAVHGVDQAAQVAAARLDVRRVRLDVGRPGGDLRGKIGDAATRGGGHRAGSRGAVGKASSAESETKRQRIGDTRARARVCGRLASWRRNPSARSKPRRVGKISEFPSGRGASLRFRARTSPHSGRRAPASCTTRGTRYAARRACSVSQLPHRRFDVRVDHDRVLPRRANVSARRPLPSARIAVQPSPEASRDGRGRPRARRRLARGEARRAPAPPASVRRVRAPVLRVRARRPGRAPLPRAGGLLPELAPVQVLRLGDVRVAARGVRDALEGFAENDVTARIDTYRHATRDPGSAQTRRSPRKRRRRDGRRRYVFVVFFKKKWRRARASRRMTAICSRRRPTSRTTTSRSAACAWCARTRSTSCAT